VLLVTILKALREEQNLESLPVERAIQSDPRVEGGISGEHQLSGSLSNSNKEPREYKSLGSLPVLLLQSGVTDSGLLPVARGWLVGP